MTPLFAMAKCDVFSTVKLRKGLENMRKLYGDFGFIDFVGAAVVRAHAGHRADGYVAVGGRRPINSSSGASFLGQHDYPATK